MKEVGYFNGNIGPLEEMTIPMTARSVYFGDGVYDAALVANGVGFDMQDHLDRFFNSLKLLKIDNFTMTREKLEEEIMRTAAAADSNTLLLYWQADRGTFHRKHSFPPKEVEANLMIMATPKVLADTRVGVKLVTVEDTRFLHCNIKTLNLIPNVLANQRAMEAGCDEAVFHRGDTVTEGSSTNVSIIRDGVLITHPADNLILPGISRKHLLIHARELGIEVAEREFTLDEMFDADEVLITGSTTFVRSACQIDGRPVGGKDRKRFEMLRSAYMNRVKEITGLDV